MIFLCGMAGSLFAGFTADALLSRGLRRSVVYKGMLGLSGAATLASFIALPQVTRYASGLAAKFGWPNAIVAQAWLNRPDAAEVLAAQAEFPLVRSVRHKPEGPRSPSEVGTSRTLMSDPEWCRGFARLAGHGLAFDLQTPWWNLDEAVELAADFPDTTIILNHAGLPGQRDADSLAAWRAAMTRFAARPNCVVKLSGLGVPGEQWTAARNGWIVRTLVELFGAERAMFGSNFPVDSLCTGFGDMMTGFRMILGTLSTTEQEAVFFGTAKRVYKLSKEGVLF